MERGGRPSVTTFRVEAPFTAGSIVALPEAAAHHARVKRLGPGDAVSVTDGAGRSGTGVITRVARDGVDVEVHSDHHVPALPPLELYAPVGDRDRMLWLAEKATELGVTAWRPVLFHRSRSVSPRGEGAAFAAKIRARMIGAMEQSGGAWLPAVHGEVDVATVATADTGGARYLLDAGGGRLPADGSPAPVAFLLGPEGGLEPAEREQLVAGGWRPVALAPTILRFETAGIAAVAVVRASQVHQDAAHG